MATGYRADALAGDGQSVTTSSEVLTIPAGAVAGDVGYITAAVNTTSTISTPTGWTLKSGPDATGSAAVNTYVWERVLQAGDAGTTVTLPLSGSVRAVAELAVISGATTTGAVYGTATVDSGVTTTTIPTLTGVAAGSLFLVLFPRRSASTPGPDVTTPSGYTAGSRAVTGYASGVQLSAETAWKIVSAGGTVGGESVTLSNSSAGSVYAVALPAATAGGSGTVALTGGGTLTVTGSGTVPGSGTVALTGGGVLVVSGSGAGNGAGTVALAGGGTLGVTGTGSTAPAAVVVPKRAVEWSAFARGTGYALTSALPILDAQIVVRHMGLDKALLTTPYTFDAWTAVQPGYGIAVYRSGRQVFSGPVSSRTLTWAPETGAATIRVEAVGDEVVLADRLAMPDPLRAADDQSVNDYWTSTGAASTAMRQLISDQAGATCAATRQVSGLTLGVDPNVGISRTWQGLFDPVLDLLATMAAASGADLGVRVASVSGALVASVVAPRNLVGTVIFSADLSNLAGFTFTETAPTAANALVAGQGDLHLRTRKAVASSDAGTTRWARQAWSYVDRRDSNDLTVLTNAGTDALVKGQGGVSLAVTLVDSDAATYGTDWDLGDKVTVYVGLPDDTKVAQVNDVIREISFTVGADGSERIQPAIGSVDARTYLPTPQQRAITATAERVTALAKNK